MLLPYKTGLSPGHSQRMTLPVRGSGASPCPALHLPPVQEAAGGSRRMMSRLRICSVGARAVLRGSSARFSPPSSPLLSFGLLLPGFASPVPSLARRCPGCFSLPGCSRVAPLLCKLTLCRVPLLTPSRFVPSCAIPSSPQPARSVPFPPDDGWRSSSESIWRGQRVPRALPGFVMCWGSSCRG